MNLYERILEAARGHEEEDAFRLPDATAVTHGRLHEQVRTIAAVLVEAGVQPGDRVTVQVEKSVANVVTYLATLRVGGVYMPLNTAYTAAELDYFLGDAQPRVLVCDPARAPELEPIAERHGVAACFTLAADGTGTLIERAGAAEPAAGEPAVAQRSPEDLAAILYTSGTTGRSKGAMLSHGNLWANAATLRRIWGWRGDDVLLHALPIYHVHGLFVALHCALLEPSPVIFLPRFDAEAVIHALPEATVYMGVPTHYVRLLASPRFTRQVAAGMRLFVSGSAPLLPETFEAFEARTGDRILERYGMTEAGMITSNPLEGPRIAGTVGPPLPDVEVRLRGADGEALAPGEVGVLEIRGPNVFSGYWQMPEKTAEEFHDGWFVTGDLASIDADGRVSIVGRHKDLVISGGLNVYPREIEAEIDAITGIRESAVIGVPHPDFGEGVVALVVVEGDWPGEDAVIAALRERLAGFKVPKRVLTVDALPRNAMGKVQKNVLRDDHRALFASS